MKTLTAGKPAVKFLYLYAAVITAALLLLILYERIPQKLLARLHPPPPPAPLIMPDSYTNSPHWAARNSFFETVSVKDKIVFVGNSITEGCNWNELFGSDEIVNRGIAGDRSAGVLRRIDDYLKDKPRCIVLMDGINDITQAVPLDTTINNYMATLGKIKAAGIPVIVQSTLYVAASYEAQSQVKGLNAAIGKLNYALAKYCQQNGAQYVDVNKELLVGDNLNPAYTPDGEHINGKAYLKWRNVLHPVLQNYLQ